MCIAAHLFSISSDPWHAFGAALVLFSDYEVVGIDLYRTIRRFGDICGSISIALAWVIEPWI